MGQVTGYTAERMKLIEDNSVVDGDVVSDNLILTKKNGVQINAGNVRGAAGPVYSGAPTLLTGPGVDETGVSDSTAAIQTIVTNAIGPVVGKPGAIYKFGLVQLKDGSVLNGNGASIISTASAIDRRGAFEAVNKTDVAVTDWKASGALGSYLLKATACKVVDVLRNKLTTLSAFVSYSANGNLYTGSSETENNDILVKDNKGTSTGGAVGGNAAVLLFYVSDVICFGNKFTGYPQGIQYWGGDANPAVNGALTNARKCKRIWMVKNRIYSAVEGGLWGSMGEHITTTNNYVENCGDVGIDFEGSSHCKASKNNVRNCASANYGTFFLCKDVTFTNNTSIADTTTSCANLMYIHNSSQDASTATGNQDITVRNNNFRVITGVGCPIVCEATSSFTFENNRCLNTHMNFRANNLHHTNVDDNDINYTSVASAAFDSIKVGLNTQAGDGVAPNINIRRNQIRSTSNQPAGSRGIFSEQSDPNSSPNLEIIDNQVQGFPSDIVSQWGGTNVGTWLRGLIARNTITNSITLTNTSAATPQATEYHSNRTFTGAVVAPSRTVTGSRGGNAAVASLLTQLSALGLIVDGSVV